MRGGGGYPHPQNMDSPAIYPIVQSMTSALKKTGRIASYLKPQFYSSDMVFVEQAITH